MKQLLDFETRKQWLFVLAFVSLPISIFSLNLSFALLFVNGLFSPGLKERIGQLQENGLLKWTSLFFALYSVSAIWSENTSTIAGALEVKSQLFSLPLLAIINGGFITQLRESIIRSFIFSCLAAILICLLGGFYFGISEGWNSDLWVYDKLTRPIGIQPIYLSLYCVMALFFSIRRLPSKLDLKNQFLKLLTPGILIIGIVLLSSRMEMLVMLAVGGSWLIYKAAREGWLAKAMVLALAGVLILGGLIALSPTNRARFQEMLNLKQSYQEDHWGGRAIRLEKWKCALEVWAEYPLLGTGIGDMQDKLDKKYLEKGLTPAYLLHFNPHNQYLQILVVLGIPGFLLFLVFMTKLFRYSVELDPWQVFFSDFRLFLLVFYLSVITESMWERQWGLSFFLLFVALFMIQPKTASTTVHEPAQA